VISRKKSDWKMFQIFLLLNDVGKETKFLYIIGITLCRLCENNLKMTLLTEEISTAMGVVLSNKHNNLTYIYFYLG